MNKILHLLQTSDTKMTFLPPSKPKFSNLPNKSLSYNVMTILFVCLSAGRVGLTLRLGQSGRNKELCLAWSPCLLPSSEWGWPRVGSCQSQPSLDINHCYLSSGEAGPASRAPPNIGWAPGGWGGCPWPRPRPPERLTSSHKSISVSSMSSQRPLHSHINSQKKYHKNRPLQKGFSIFWPVACCFLRPLAWLFYISLGSVTHNYLLAQAQPQASTCQICAISKSIIFMTFNFPVLKASLCWPTGCHNGPTFSLRCLFLLPAKWSNCVISDKQS